ncbi:hypothetical protein PbB2_02287 [Candidatus Phycosocius bacilliformis]|uniref:Uncharacterized protein n=1 Tax=Candidatus Phycosocius bacilliformis TaxID=1445552 RepID=A0A2P2EBZ9_9PROT|nr:hypothetical protein [Candidatus Phycosocius bacilliformis]GBF58600.1 hypothetical protein PbB2_02287 [Candidatus Phycosocius bacilliformis]
MSGVRSLAALTTTASTSRVLNLHLVSSEFADDPARVNSPFFFDAMLNRAIIIKHRLRSDETYLLNDGTAVATKIMFPLDREDLKAGGRSILVNQTGWKGTLMEVLGATEYEIQKDLEILEMLNELPSLDPFLVREQLRRHQHFPADCYFAISPADSNRMQSFTSSEMSPLIQMAFGQKNGSIDPELVKKLADALLSTNADSRLEPLRATLGLEGERFAQGIFSWKGFIYYKWQFSETFHKLSRIATEMDQVKIKGRVDKNVREEIDDLKKSIRTNIRDSAKRCQSVLQLYDDAFRDLVERGNTAAFRKFLLDAPALFIELGHSMGIISHISSFWAFRFNKDKEKTVEVLEFLDILREFESGLAPKRATMVTW